MADYKTLKDAVRNVIKANGNQEITGEILQSILLNIITTFGDDYSVLGFIEPNDEPYTDGRALYFANTPGVYSKCSNISIQQGEFAIIASKDDETWEKRPIFNLSESLKPLIANNLEGGVDKALSAEQGKILNLYTNKLIEDKAKNVFANYETIINSGWINNQGEIFSPQSINWKYNKQLIDLRTVLEIKCTNFELHPSVSNISYYDKDKKFISALQFSGNKTIKNFPEKAVYVRMCTGANSGGECYIHIKEHVLVSVKEQLQFVSDIVESLKNINIITTDLCKYFNLNRQPGYINADSIFWKEAPLSPWSISDFIPVIAGDALKYSGFTPHENIRAIAFYNKENIFIGSTPVNTSAGVVTVPLNAKFARFSGAKVDKWSVIGKIAITEDLISAFNKIQKGAGANYEGEVNITNADSVLVEGSSYTESVCTPVGFSWIEKLNDVIDIPVINDGVSGSSRTVGIERLKYNSTLVNTPSISSNEFSYRYVMINNSANGSKMGLEGYKELLVIKNLIESKGAEMILGSEEGGLGTSIANLFEAFAEKEKVKCGNNIQIIASKCYPSSTYSGQIYSGHLGHRGVAVYSANTELYKQLPIRQTIKAYRLRPNLGTPIEDNDMNDFIYQNPNIRATLFYSLSAGQNGTSTSPKVSIKSSDNLDFVTYAKPSTDYDIDYREDNLSRESDLAKFLSGKEVEFNQIALIEFILNIDKLQKASISFSSNIKPGKIFVAEASQFIPAEFVYDDSTKTVQLDLLSERFLIKDKISILVINKENKFKLSNPSCKYSGRQKSISSFNFTKRKFGIEILSDTSIEAFNGENQKITLPKNLDLYTAYSSSKQILVLSDHGKKSYRIFESSETAKYAVRIIAQSFKKILTTRFRQPEYLDYVEANSHFPDIENNIYDRSSLIVDFDNGSWVAPLTVENGWTEIYFEINLSKGSHSISLQNELISENHSPIWVHAISIQKI